MFKIWKALLDFIVVWSTAKGHLSSTIHSCFILFSLLYLNDK